VLRDRCGVAATLLMSCLVFVAYLAARFAGIALPATNAAVTDAFVCLNRRVTNCTTTPARLPIF